MEGCIIYKARQGLIKQLITHFHSKSQHVEELQKLPKST